MTEPLLRGCRVTKFSPTKTVPNLKTDPSVHIEKLALIMGRLSCLRADVREKKLGVLEIHQQASEIAEELSDWERNLPRYYRSESLSPSESVWVFQILNSYRYARIILYWNVMSGLAKPDTFRRSLQALASDIFASRPGKAATPEYGIIQSPIHCMASLWHLALAATAGCEVRGSIKACLRTMSERMHIGQSSVLLGILEHEEDITEALQVDPSCEYFWIRPTMPYIIRAILPSATYLSNPEILKQARQRFPSVCTTRGWRQALMSALCRNEVCSNSLSHPFLFHNHSHLTVSRVTYGLVRAMAGG